MIEEGLGGTTPKTLSTTGYVQSDVGRADEEGGRTGGGRGTWRKGEGRKVNVEAWWKEGRGGAEEDMHIIATWTQIHIYIIIYSFSDCPSDRTMSSIHG